MRKRAVGRARSRNRRSTGKISKTCKKEKLINNQTRTCMEREQHNKEVELW